MASPSNPPNRYKRRKQTANRARHEPNPSDANRFINMDAFEIFNSVVKDRQFTAQRGVNPEDPETLPMRMKCYGKGWKKFSMPGDSYSPLLVREFYANLYAMIKQKERKEMRGPITFVSVRGCKVKFTHEAIHDMLELTNTPLADRDYMGEQPSNEEICRYLSAPMSGWKRRRGNSGPLVYTAKDLSWVDGAWNHFIHRNIDPGQHESAITEYRMTILYKIQKGFYLDIPTLIWDGIYAAGRRLNTNLCFPQLITDLIRAAGVDVAGISIAQFSPNPLISVRHIRLHGARVEKRPEGEEAAHGEGAEEVFGEPEADQEQPEDIDLEWLSESAIAGMPVQAIEKAMFAPDVSEIKSIKGGMAKMMKKIASFVDKMVCKSAEVEEEITTLRGEVGELRDEVAAHAQQVHGEMENIRKETKEAIQKKMKQDLDRQFERCDSYHYHSPRHTKSS